MRQQLQRMIGDCAAAYQEERDKPVRSIVLRGELEELRSLAARLEEAGPEELLRQLREEAPALQASLDRETECPSFDWYDDHYHAELLMGVQNARKAVLTLLEQKSPPLAAKP